MTGAMQVSPSQSEPVEGLSDEREAERWAASMGGNNGLGEAFANLHDAQELGLSG